MEHTRSGLKRLIPRVGDSLLTNKRRPILTVVEDTCGVHDTLMSACDIYRYQVSILPPTNQHSRIEFSYNASQHMTAILAGLGGQRVPPFLHGQPA